MRLSVPCSIVYKSQDVEAALMSLDRGMDKEVVVHIDNGILLSQKRNKIMALAET